MVVFTAALATYPRRDKCSWKVIDNPDVVDTYNGYYSDLNRSRIPTYATIWISLEAILLSK